MRQVQSCPPTLFGTAAEHAGLGVSCSLREPEGPQLGTRHGETHLTPGYHGSRCGWEGSNFKGTILGFHLAEEPGWIMTC